MLPAKFWTHFGTGENIYGAFVSEIMKDQIAESGSEFFYGKNMGFFLLFNLLPFFSILAHNAKIAKKPPAEIFLFGLD